jgi:hypothetical protein
MTFKGYGFCLWCAPPTVISWDLIRHDSVKAICGNILLHYLLFMVYHFLASCNVLKYYGD